MEIFPGFPNFLLNFISLLTTILLAPYLLARPLLTRPLLRLLPFLLLLLFIRHLDLRLKYALLFHLLGLGDHFLYLFGGVGEI